MGARGIERSRDSYSIGNARGREHGVKVNSAAQAAGKKWGQVEVRSQRALGIPQEMTTTEEVKQGTRSPGEQTRRDTAAG